MKKLRDWAKQLKQYIYALYLSASDNRTPWYAKLIMFAVIAYALSPLDLIPDFIPVLGLLDDLLLLPIGIYCAIKLSPKAVWSENKKRAQQHPQQLSKNYWAALFIVFIWLFIAGIGGYYLLGRFAR